MPANRRYVDEAKSIVSGEAFEQMDVLHTQMSQEEREHYVKAELSEAVKTRSIIKVNLPTRGHCCSNFTLSLCRIVPFTETRDYGHIWIVDLDGLWKLNQ